MAAPSSAKRRWRLPLGGLAWLLLAPSAVAALESLDEAALAEVQARDGLTLTLDKATPLAGNRLNWSTDVGSAPVGACAGGIANQQACTWLSASLAGAGGAPLHASLDLDVGDTGSYPALRLGLDWNPLLLQAGLTLSTPTVDYSARTLGQFGLYSQGSLQLTNHGLFSSAGNTATLLFSTTGDVIYRQGPAGSAELSLANFQLANRFSTGAANGQSSGVGRIGIDSQGLLVSAPYTYTSLLFDLMFKANPTDFDTGGRQPILQAGWQGGLANALVRVSSGGVAYGTHAAGSHSYFDGSGPGASGPRSEGLNLLAQWDFDTDFTWILGQAGGNRTQARLSNWRRMATLPAGTPMLAMPLTLDVLQNGAGPAGLCFGGGFASGVPVQASCTGVTPSGAPGLWVPSTVPTGKAAFALQIRDGHLHAYNQQIEVRDPSVGATTVYRNALVYTFGKLDSDIHLYPEGRNPGTAISSNDIGLKADITLAIQSPGYWDRANSSVAATRAGAGSGWAGNTHFLLADTAVGGDTGKQYGVGIVNADLLWTARDLYFRVTPPESGAGSYSAIPGGLWLQTDTGAAYRFRGLLGGGNLLDLSTPTAVALIDLNLSTGRFLFALSPSAQIAGDVPIRFDGLLDLDGNAWLSLGEVSSPASAFRLSGVSGRIGWQNGSVNLVSGQNTPDALPRLTISNDLLFGGSANFGAGGGAPVLATAGFGSENFGRMTLPAGQWSSNVTIKIPNN